MNKNELAIRLMVFRRRGSFLMSNERAVGNTLVPSVLYNVSSLGLIPTKSAYDKMNRMSVSSIIHTFDRQILKGIEELLGGSIEYRPMYPNFPEQVANASESELFVNAIMHYFGDIVGARILPVYLKDKRAPLDFAKMKPFDIVGPEVVEEILISMLSSNVSPSVQDLEDMKTIIDSNYVLVNQAFIEKVGPNIKNREVFALFWALCYAKRVDLIEYVKSVNDFLRLAVAFSNGDVSLAEDSRIKLDRAKRFFIMNHLNVYVSKRSDEDLIDLCFEDAFRFHEKWKRLGEVIHPSESSYSHLWFAQKIFQVIRNEKKRSFYSRVESAFKDKDYNTVVSLLSSRPGEMVRSANRIFQNISNVNVPVLAGAMYESSLKASPGACFSAYKFFKNRHLFEGKERYFFPKGNLSKVIISDEPLRKVGQKSSGDIALAIMTGLTSRLKELPQIGKVYISPECREILVSGGNRSASKGLRTVPRGSRFSFKEADTIRLFMYWKDTNSGYNSRVDLDLSAMIYDEDFKYISHCAFTNLRGDGFAHSGDITSAPNGASEFIDINIDTVLKKGKPRYVVATVTSFTGQKFSDLDTAFFGFMERKGNSQNGEIYEPKTVQTRIDLRSQSTVTCPVIFDLKEKVAIWADTSIFKEGGGHFYGSTKSKTQIVGKAIVGMDKLNISLGSLVSLHVRYRGGEFVNDPEQADVVVAETGTINPYDPQSISSALLNF